MFPRQPYRHTAFLALQARQLRYHAVEKRYPYRRQRLLPERLHPRSAHCHHHLVMVMLPIAFVMAIAMVAFIHPTCQRMLKSAVGHPTVMQHRVPGGKEPAEQRQQSEDSTDEVHADRIGETPPFCQSRYLPMKIARLRREQPPQYDEGSSKPVVLTAPQTTNRPPQVARPC